MLPPIIAEIIVPPHPHTQFLLEIIIQNNLHDIYLATLQQNPMVLMDVLMDNVTLCSLLKGTEVSGLNTTFQIYLNNNALAQIVFVNTGYYNGNICEMLDFFNINYDAVKLQTESLRPLVDQILQKIH